MKQLFTLLLCLALLIPGMAQAEGLNLNGFKRLPILHEGRIKPLDAFARVELKRIYGSERFHALPAIDLLALALFDPALIAAAPIIPVRDLQLRQQLGLDHRTERHFSLNDLKDGLQATAPLLPPLMARDVTLTDSQKTLLQPHDHAVTLIQMMETLNQGNAANINMVMRVIPPTDPSQQDWLSPRQNQAAAAPWYAMRDAWAAQDQVAWDKAVSEAYNAVKDHVDPARLDLEILYRAIKPLNWAEGLYLIAFLLTIASFFCHARPLTHGAMIAAGCGLMAHAIGIVMRVLILDRPPVATLYETLIFVSAVVVFCALLVELDRKNRLPLLAGLGCGLALLLAAPAFAPAGDSLEMLVAVLNTGFWLSTHVICITIGYGVCLLTATLAHFALVQPAARLDSLIHKTLIVALFFTAFGTMLGGIWADQSWGRFWGWDPKENGALLIVLWIGWILHGRYAGMLKGVLLNAATAFLAVIVALAWFGVNLLNIGLHSYGFTDSMALGLALFCALEIGFVALALIRGRRTT